MIVEARHDIELGPHRMAGYHVLHAQPFQHRL